MQPCPLCPSGVPAKSEFDASAVFCPPPEAGPESVRTSPVAPRRIIATLGMRMQSGSSTSQTAHIKSNMASITPQPSQRTFMGRMIISMFVLAYYMLYHIQQFFFHITLEDSHVIPGLFHKCYLAKSAFTLSF